jgi:CRISPR-associated protein Csb1
MSLTYDQLLAFVRTHAGIRAVTALEPLGGPGTKVFPPTYGVDDPAPVTRYAVEERIITDAEGGETRVVESVVLNSVAAQAHAFPMRCRQRGRPAITGPANRNLDSLDG